MCSQHAKEAIERKVQLTGSSTYSISLPKTWAVDRGIESGASMYLYPHHDRLIVASRSLDRTDRETTIEANAIEPAAVRRRIDAAYRAGCDEITVANDAGIDAETRLAVTEAAGRFLGLEVVRESETSITARNLLDADEVSFEQTLTQIRGLALAMHEDAVDALERGDEKLAARVVERDDDVDRFFAIVARSFHRGLGDVTELDRLDVDRATAWYAYRTARQLERLGDLATRIASVARQSPDISGDRPDPRLATVAGDARAVVELALDGKLQAATDAHTEVRSSIDSLERAFAGGDGSYRDGVVLECVRRTAALGGNVATATAERRAVPNGAIRGHSTSEQTEIPPTYTETDDTNTSQTAEEHGRDKRGDGAGRNGWNAGSGWSA
ncbi:phosphate uptake regulator PhoU [Halobacteria archaeon AArc-dxtr1]|nr:phosphate uptake regulator PhoU [Halobacteria archaeon AArc-dxtr1]